MDNGAVIVIDMLNDFADPKGKLYCETAKEVIPKIKQVVDAARANNVSVFYLNDSHLKEDRELELWGPHAMRRTWGAEVVKELSPRDVSEIVEKRWYSGFAETDLDERLKKLGVRTIYITGMHTNICDRHTSADGYVKGYKIVMVSDATGTFTPQDHAAGLDYIKTMYGAQIKTSAEVAEDFKL